MSDLLSVVERASQSNILLARGLSCEEPDRRPGPGGERASRRGRRALVTAGQELSDYARWVLEAPLPEHQTPPTGSYFICSGQRSGTWLLSGLLDGTGVAGHPHEFFEPGTEQANRRRWRVGAGFGEYLAAVFGVGTTENGVFASSVMWPSLVSLLKRLRGPGAAVEGDRLLVERFFPQPRYVFLWREDVVAQAVSWARAVQTGYYHHWDRPVGKATFELDQIDALVREASANSASWRRWFAENEIEPFVVRFEDLVENKEPVTRSVLAFLEIELPSNARIAARTIQAGDFVNAEWIARYKRSQGKEEGR
ncbi:MAG TPA: Stf0 family sulfotransferase [Gaiellaceae bacterium]